VRPSFAFYNTFDEIDVSSMGAPHRRGVREVTLDNAVYGGCRITVRRCLAAQDRRTMIVG